MGLAGWIVNRVLGRQADVDESAAKESVAELCRLGLANVTPTRWLEARKGGRVWRRKHRA